MKNSFIIILLLIALCSISFSLSIKRVPQHFVTIQSAINTAKTGDTVLIDDGIYFENILIKKNIILCSRFLIDSNRSHIERTIIDGSRGGDKRKASTVLITGCTDTTCILLGFTIRGGRGTYEHVPGDLFSEHWIGGGGVCLLKAGARVAQNIICDNSLRSDDSITFVFGAGIATLGTSHAQPLPPFLIIEQNMIISNTCSAHTSEASGLWIGQPAIIRNNVVTGNRAFSRWRSFGGGVFVSLTNDYDIIVDGNYIANNRASIGGGALVTCAFKRHGRAIFINNIFSHNEALEIGGAVNVAEQSYAIFVNNTIIGNKAMSCGGGINVTFGAHAVLVNNIIWKNTTDQVSKWGVVQSAHNAIEGGFPGKNNFADDPELIPGDSLFRLSEKSPCLATGIVRYRLADEPFELPHWDMERSRRPLPSGSSPDVGAIESAFEPGTASYRVQREQHSAAEGQLALTILYQQTTRAEHHPESYEITRGGRMSAKIIVNDSVRAVNQDSSNNLSFTLPPGKNFIELEVVGRAMNNNKRLGAFFWLEGFDPQVSVLSSRYKYSYHYYADLKPGSYRLIVQPEDQERFIGHTNKIAIAIAVVPYWYSRWWAYVLLVLGIGILLTLMFSQYIVRLRREKKLQQEFMQRQMEDQDAERKRLASELHDGLGQDLLIAKNELGRLISKHPSSTDDFHLAGEVIDESIQTVREISSNLHPHQIDQLGFCAAVRAMAKKLEISSGIHLRCECEFPEEILPKATRIHLYRIVQESLTNIVKHASASEIRLNALQFDNAVRIMIEDNGIGFDRTQVPASGGPVTSSSRMKGYGIENMSQRARIIGAEFSISSIPQRGTTISVVLPLRGVSHD